MKTKLLLLLLFISAFVNAQINVTEGFESGTIPTGWATNNFSINNAIACSGSFSCSANLTGLGSGGELATATYVSTGNSMTVTCDYRKGGGIGTSIFYLQYYNFSTSSWVTITTSNSSSAVCQTLTGTIPAGTIPAGANVVFKMYIYATSNASVFYIDNFTAKENIPLTIAQYNFDNTYNNVLGSEPFASNAGTSFTTDRHGNTTGAINVNNTGSTASILGLPYGNAARTVSIWAKMNFLYTQINYLFHYGNQANGNGCAITPTQALFFAGSGGNLTPTTNHQVTFWYHYVCTYDGTTAKIYKDGTLLSSAALTWNTVNNSNFFKLGVAETGNTTFWIGAFDDLKIYNYALTQTEVSNLYSNNTLSSENFNLNNLEVSIYPNPTNDVLNIETASDLKSIEIYNIQGQKVLSSNQKQINVSTLPSGIYMIRIQDAENAIVTKKVIIK